MQKLKILWVYLCSNFWFIPILVISICIIFSMLLIHIDTTFQPEWLAKWPRVFGTGAEGARGILSTIANSMMSVVGITFSMTIMILALAASQYSSRILRNFISNHFTQFVLGSFTGIFTYCLIVLRTIRTSNELVFVPRLSVLFGIILAIIGVCILIFFIHHIATSIQASNIISAIAEETQEAINTLFPESLGKGSNENENMAFPVEQKWFEILSRKSGYIQSIDTTQLLGMANEWKTTVRMVHGIGEFVVENTPLVSFAFEPALKDGVSKPSIHSSALMVQNPEALQGSALQPEPDQAKIDALRGAFVIGRYRTVGQDLAFGIRQLVDIALKALSPGINDTTTAIMCINYLKVILSQLSARKIPSNFRFEKGELRFIAKAHSFEDLLALSFDQIRTNAKNNTAVILSVLEAIDIIASQTDNPHHLRALFTQMQCISELSERTLEASYDRTRVNMRLLEVRKNIEAAMQVQ